MKSKIILILVIFVLSFMMFFYFLPFNKSLFVLENYDSNFSLNESEMQFYSNMRFPDSRISYKISDCTLQKQNEMESALKILENLTLLEFYSVGSDEEILVTCDSRNKFDGNLFVAGEGGPLNVSAIGNFVLIQKGKILLIRNSDCARPNIAIHELLHVLGFKHSENSRNIMYNITNCDQEISGDILQLINDLYSIPSYSDLAFENVSASINGRFLNLNMTILNLGFEDSGDSNILILFKNKTIETVDLGPIEIGTGKIVYLENILVSGFNFDEFELEILYSYNEINKENNKIKLKIKNEN